jgi:hypothetical protein
VQDRIEDPTLSDPLTGASGAAVRVTAAATAPGCWSRSGQDPDDPGRWSALWSHSDGTPSKLELTSGLWLVIASPWCRGVVPSADGGSVGVESSAPSTASQPLARRFGRPSRPPRDNENNAGWTLVSTTTSIAVLEDAEIRIQIALSAEAGGSNELKIHYEWYCPPNFAFQALHLGAVA